MNYKTLDYEPAKNKARKKESWEAHAETGRWNEQLQVWEGRPPKRRWRPPRNTYMSDFRSILNSTPRPLIVPLELVTQVGLTCAVLWAYISRARNEAEIDEVPLGCLARAIKLPRSKVRYYLRKMVNLGWLMRDYRVKNLRRVIPCKPTWVGDQEAFLFPTKPRPA